MSNDKSKIEIGIKATGGDAAAEEIKKAEVAIDDLGSATSSGANDVAEVTDAVEEMADGMVAAGNSSGGLGSKLIGLAGGPITIVTTVVTALAGWLVSLKQRLEAASEVTDSLRGSTAALADRISEFQTPVTDATIAIEAHGTAMDLLVEKSDAANAAFDRRRKELDMTREAEIAYRTALIDRQVSEGKITEEEGAAQKGNLEKESIDRENAAALAAAEAKIQSTQAALDTARNEVTAAKEALRSAKSASPETESARLADDARRAASDARLKAEAAEATRQAEIKNASLAGGLAGPIGAAVAGGLEAKAQAELVEKLNAEAAAREADAAKFLEQAEKERKVRDDLIAAKQAEVDAAMAAAKALAEQQASAAAELREADLAAKIAETYTKPTIDVGTSGEIAKIQAKEAAEKAKADEAARQAAAKARADAEARAIAADLSRAGSNGAAAGVSKEDVNRVNSVASSLGDGTNLNELGGAVLKLADVMESLDASQRATIKGLIDRLSNVESNLRAGR